MANTHEQQQDSHLLHRPTWRTSNGLGCLRSRFQNLPAEVLLVIIEQFLQPEAKRGNLQDLGNGGPSPSELQRLGLPVLPSPTPNTAQAQKPDEAQKPTMPDLAELFYLGLLNDRLRELIPPMLESHARSNSSRSTNASMSPTSQTDPSGLYSYILIFSTIRGLREGIIAALDRGADINANDGIEKSLAVNRMTDNKPTGSCLTALHWAAFNRDTAMLRLLLDRGADVRRTAVRTTYSSMDAHNPIRAQGFRPHLLLGPGDRLEDNAKTLVNALGFALQANYRLLPDGMTEQQRQAFVADRDMRDEEAVRILVEAGCPAFVMEHREREFNDACELERWGVARDILANTEWRRRCAERDDDSSRLSLVRVVRGRNPSRRVMGCNANEW
ncbi:hypothetical protein CaCOL14_003432 [Colletotrichum acutatum]|uniref:Ankyrin n=1 Tax=Glomerella acutata TaxID=27357 RepID=A0AAD8UE32_GLOAC|nr:uncharacterized protein BDZ83DRAFT_734584 [Colletotrichum acutatum]KAK1713803.1 hypothetical protein BDZ83DRAFT_734584 [Colletotrichum acutatum]